MSEEELLRKIANAAIDHDRALKTYRFLYSQHVRKHGRFYRTNETAMTDYEEKVVVANKAAKEAKRQLDGYLFMYEQKQWAKS